MADAKRLELSQLLAYRYIIGDQDGNEHYESNSIITISTTYANMPVIYNNHSVLLTDISSNLFSSTSATYLKLDQTCFGAEYADKYWLESAQGAFAYAYNYNPFAYYNVGTTASLTITSTLQSPWKLKANVHSGYQTPLQQPPIGYKGLENVNTVFFRVFAFMAYDRNANGHMVYTDPLYVNFKGIGDADAPFTCNAILIRCDPTYTIIAPTSGSFVDDSHDITINWGLGIMPSISGKTYPTTELAFLWGEDQSTSNVITLDKDALDVTIPVGTFPAKSTVYWRLRYKSDIAEEYQYTDLATYTTTDTIPSVSLVSPVNSSISGEIANTFVWSYQIETNSPQKAFDLQISNNGGASWTDVFSHAESEETSATIPADTFLAGTGMWRVRVYNTDNDASAWSDPASIVVRAAPKPPTISRVINTPKITVEWQATGQQGYQIKANDYDSGALFGTIKTYKIPVYYLDGDKVSLSVRAKNRFGEWSEWTTVEVTIANTSPGSIQATANATDTAAVIQYQATGEFAGYYILRDGQPIGKGAGGQYIDYSAADTSEYQVMGVDTNGNYALSNTVSAVVLPSAAVIGIVGTDIDFVALNKRRGGTPEIQTKKSEDISYQYYSGRRLPLAYSARATTREKSLSYTVYKDDADKIMDMVGEVVIYKDYAGNKIIGVLNNAETSGRATRPDITLTITEIDYSEVIPYD